jgi:hypothetical protein
LHFVVGWSQIRPAERFGFWKTEGAAHLADGSGRIELDALADGWAYTASEWSGSADGAPIILLEAHH